MLKRVLFVIVAVLLLSQFGFGKMAKIEPNIYQGQIQKIDNKKYIVTINGESFKFKKSLLGELKALKKIHRKIRIKFKEKNGKKILEKIIYKIEMKKPENKGKF